MRQLTAGNGEITLSKAYDPYGVVSASNGTSQTSYGFTGETTDSYIKLIYLRSRQTIRRGDHQRAGYRWRQTHLSCCWRLHGRFAPAKSHHNADSADSEVVKAALDAMSIFTFFGRIKFDISAEAHGLQVGHSMVVIQWQKDDVGELVREVIWPLDVATNSPIFPLPAP